MLKAPVLLLLSWVVYTCDTLWATGLAYSCVSACLHIVSAPRSAAV